MRNPLNMLIPIRPGWSMIRIGSLFDALPWAQKMRFGNSFVIEIEYPGIGDHLFLSPLPELLIKSGMYKNVYVSNKSKRTAAALMDIIWKANPYVSGIVDTPGWKNSGLRPNGGSFLDGIVAQFSGKIPEPGTTRPVLYKTERFDKYTKNESPYVLVDLNRISNKHVLNEEKIKEHLEDELVNRFSSQRIYAYQNELFERIVTSSIILKGLRDKHVIVMREKEPSLEQYFAYIRKAEHVYCLYSGGSHIAAACERRTTVYCQSKDPTQSYAGNEYIVC